MDGDMEQQARESLAKAEADLINARGELNAFLRGETRTLQGGLALIREAGRKVERAAVLTERARALELSG